jgi:hypothetical protein
MWPMMYYGRKWNPDEDLMLKVNGVSFRCSCGCNVFRRFCNNPLRYICNSCRETYTGER